MIQPISSRLLVQRIDQARPESSLIVVPDTVRDKPSQFAAVLAIGKLNQGGVEVGDLVVLKDFCGAPVFTVLPGDTTETECAFVDEEDVLAVVEV